MSIKIVHLASGERFIADVYECRSRPSDDVVGYAVVHPQIFNAQKVVASATVSSTNEPEFKVVFTPWNPFVKHQHFKFNAYAIMTISDAREDIEEIYRSEFYVENYEFKEELLELLYYDHPTS
jgi:hypothetical protein|tara:strand:+ start:839 stop:1207 length:369 start_codon:yes stop_codon:yes gene_type:complete